MPGKGFRRRADPCFARAPAAMTETMPPDPPRNTPFAALDPQQLRELLLRLRLYAQWKVRAASHRDPALDPQDLALKAVADTLDGSRRFDPGRVDLLRHLTGCIDSYVSHRLASAAVRRESPAHESAALAERMPGDGAGPEEQAALASEVQELCAWVARSHPRLEALLRLVVEEGYSLADRREVARALGLDPDVPAQMQQVYRRINALQDAVAHWRRARGEAAP